MKFIFSVLTLSLALSACAPDSGKNSNGGTPPTDQVTSQNLEILTLNDWCASVDTDRDGKIGAFRFNKNGKVTWVGIDTTKNEAYGIETMDYTLRRDVVQMGVNIGTSFAEKINFNGFGPDRLIQFTSYSLDQGNNSGDGSNVGVIAQPNFTGRVCNLNPYIK